MVTSRQRQRQLARARWDRQQARRSTTAERNRRIGIAVGIVVALLAAAALVWLILHIVNAEDTRQQQVPSSDLVPTGPTTAESTSPPASTGPVSSPASTTVSRPATSASTAATTASTP